MKKIISVLLAAALLVVMVTACKTDAGSDTLSPGNADGTEGLENIGITEVAQFPDLSANIPNIDNLVLSGDKIHFTSAIVSEDDPNYQISQIYSIHTDGSGLTLLQNYQETHETPEPAQGATMLISNLCVDSSGDIWVSEVAYFYYFDLPNGVDIDSASDSELRLSRRFFHVSSSVRKLDSSGAEITVIDVSQWVDETGITIINAIAVDSGNRLYIAIEANVHVFDSEGGFLTSLNSSGVISSVLRMRDGSVSATVFIGSGNTLRDIDIENRVWGAELPLPENAFDLFPGNDEFMLCFVEGVSLYGVNNVSREAEPVLCFTDYGIFPNMITSLIFMPDRHVMLTNQYWDEHDNRKTDWHMFTIIPHSVLDEKTTLKLVTIGYDLVLQELVMSFNLTSSTHRIEVKDYFEQYNFEDGYSVLYDRIALDIITGDVPDIINVSNMPYFQWAATGLFVDLLPLIESDPNMNKDDLMDIIYTASNTSSRLYQVFPSFGVHTIVGHPTTVGTGMGWTWDEFRSVIESHPDADIPIGYINNEPERNDVYTLTDWVSANMGNFIDWDNARALFDRGDFAQLLEFLKHYGDVDWNSVFSEENYLTPQELIADGRQLMYTRQFGSFGSFNEYSRICVDFGGDFVFKGYPTEHGIGNIGYFDSMALTITESCADKQAAWAFVRTILTEDWQREQLHSYGNNRKFPTNRIVFEEEAANAMLETTDEFLIALGLTALTQEQLDRVLDMIDSITSVSGMLPGTLDDIVTEGASDFFNGRVTAEDAARIIQSRVSIFIAEQSR